MDIIHIHGNLENGCVLRGQNYWEAPAIPTPAIAE